MSQRTFQVFFAFDKGDDLDLVMRRAGESPRSAIEGDPFGGVLVPGNRYVVIDDEVAHVFKVDRHGVLKRVVSGKGA